MEAVLALLALGLLGRAVVAQPAVVAGLLLAVLLAHRRLGLVQPSVRLLAVLRPGQAAERRAEAPEGSPEARAAP